MKKQTRRDFITKSTLGSMGAFTGFSAMANEKSTELQNNRLTGKTYKLKRDVPVEEEFDVVVAGGGPSGVGAALSAARLGAKVLLVEATGCMGGMGSSGLVTAFDPMADGKEMLVGGIMREIVMKLYNRGFLSPREKLEVFTTEYHHWTGFNVEGYKLVLDELMIEAGVEVRFFTKVIDAEANPQKGFVEGVILHNIEGYRYIKSKTFIDCTGDAVLADLCGASCREAGRDTPNIMPATLCSYFSNIDWKDSDSVGTSHPILLKAIEDGHFTNTDRHLPGVVQIGQTLGYLNGGHVYNLNSLRCRSLSDGMMFGRKIAQEYLSFFRKYVKGYENIEHATTASVMGVRESRRVLGEYELNFEDYLARRTFPDQIGIFNKAVDIHAYDDSQEAFDRFIKEYNETGRLKPGEHFGIPYSILVPKEWSNLWVAGRCASADLKVHGSIRVQPAANMMGQAAGTAAAQSIRTGQPACDLNTETLVSTLRKEGAKLPQQNLSPKMTRS